MTLSHSSFKNNCMYFIISETLLSAPLKCIMIFSYINKYFFKMVIASCDCDAVCQSCPLRTSDKHISVHSTQWDISCHVVFLSCTSPRNTEWHLRGQIFWLFKPQHMSKHHHKVMQVTTFMWIVSLRAQLWVGCFKVTHTQTHTHKIQQKI